MNDIESSNIINEVNNIIGLVKNAFTGGVPLRTMATDVLSGIKRGSHEILTNTLNKANTAGLYRTAAQNTARRVVKRLATDPTVADGIVARLPRNYSAAVKKHIKAAIQRNDLSSIADNTKRNNVRRHLDDIVTTLSNTTEKAGPSLTAKGIGALSTSAAGLGSIGYLYNKMTSHKPDTILNTNPNPEPPPLVPNPPEIKVPRIENISKSGNNSLGLGGGLAAAAVGIGALGLAHRQLKKKKSD